MKGDLMKGELAENTLGDRSSGGSLGPPQFGLRGLFLWVTGFSLLFGAMAMAGAIWAMMITLAALLIGGHVVGNSLATKLRDRSTAALKEAALKSSKGIHSESIRSTTTERDIPPPSMLRFRVPLCRKIHLTVALSALGGGVFSGWALIWFYPGQISIVGLLFGSICAAVIGGWFGLLASTFVSVTHRAWREAIDYHEQNS